MKSFLFMACVVFSFGAKAVTSVGIHSIVKGHEGEPHLVKFNSGAVEFIEQDDAAKLAEYEAIMLASKDMSSELDYKSFNQIENDFEPTLVPESEIASIFKRMNPFMRRRSECSDRAHVWAWDEFQRTGIKSQKAFLMLTDTYIKRHRYKWWFHVAPMFTTDTGNQMVMDKQFLDRAVPFEEWKNYLVFTKRDCVREFRFIDYDAGADQTQDCYVKIEPMYYYIPGDIGSRERGRAKTGWSQGEVNASRSRAFFKGSIQ